MGGKSAFLRGLFKNGFFLVLLLALAIAFLIGFGKAFWQDYQIRKEINQLIQEKEKWEKNRLISLEKLQEIKGDNFVEKEARLKFGLGKEGEKLVIINKVNAPTPSVNTEANQAAARISNPRKWWNYFFK